MAFFEFSTNQMYVQGEGALYELKRYCYPLGSKFLVVLGCGPLTQKVTDMVKKSFDNTMESNVQPSNPKSAMALRQAQRLDKENKKNEYSIVDFEGRQVTYENIDELTKIAKEKQADVLIGIGGGKALDLVRGVHHKTGARVVLVPTAAATNGPATGLNVIYKEDGSEVLEVQRMDGFPDVVIADTALLITAPPHTLAAGIGDCLCTNYETEITTNQLGLRKNYVDNAWYAIEAQRKIYYDNAYLAMKAVETQKITPAFESIIAVILNMSGPIRSVVNMNLAHTVDEVVMKFEAGRKLSHGFLVAYGVIPMMVYASFPLEEIYRYVDLCTDIGIPVTFEQLGIGDVTAEELEKASEMVENSDVVKRRPVKFTKDDFWKNMLLGEKIVTDYLSCK